MRALDHFERCETQLTCPVPPLLPCSEALTSIKNRHRGLWEREGRVNAGFGSCDTYRYIFFPPLFTQPRPVRAKPSDAGARMPRRTFLRPRGRFGSQKVLSASAFLCGRAETPFPGTVGSLSATNGEPLSRLRHVRAVTCRANLLSRGPEPQRVSRRRLSPFPSQFCPPALQI